MATARSTFRTNLTYALGNRSDLTNARLDAWLNEALLDMSSKIRIRNLEVRDTTQVLSTLSNRLPLPATVLVPLHIRNTTQDRPLDYMD